MRSSPSGAGLLFSTSPVQMIGSNRRPFDERRSEIMSSSRRRPTSTGDLAQAILAIADAVQRPDFAAWGTYHYAGADTVTRHGFATMIFAEAGKFGRKAPRVRPITTAELPTAAPRPAYSVLSTAKLERIFGIRPCPLRAGLIATLARLLGKRDTA